MNIVNTGWIELQLCSKLFTCAIAFTCIYKKTCAFDFYRLHLSGSHNLLQDYWNHSKLHVCSSKHSLYPPPPHLKGPI